MERLDKLIADNFNLSRKEARQAIKNGGVTIDDVIVKNPETRADDSARIVFGASEISNSKYSYIMLNKPAGVISATIDNHSKTVLDILPQEMLRKGLFPAGRLDKDTEGFVFITNDGELAHKMLSPKNHIAKRYFAELEGKFDEKFDREFDKEFDFEEIKAAFEKGVDIGDEEITLPAQLTKTEGSAGVELVIYEGRYHQVKRMFALFNLKVIYLKRLAIGGLLLDETLAVGQCKALTKLEIEKIFC